MDHRPPRPDQPYAWDDERLSAYLDGELSAPEQAQLEARLVVDPELRQLVDELRAVRQQLEILPEYRLKPSFADQVLHRAEQEMLLAPLGRETAEPIAAAATPPAPTLAAAATPSITAPTVTTAPTTTLPARASSRLWRRGAIWTAVAAAAVLLLMVTNRPNAPQQDHVARSDRPDVAMPISSAGKDLAAPTATPAGVDKTLQNLQGAKENEQLRLAKNRERDAQQSPLEQALPSTSTVVGEADGKNAGSLPPAIPFGAAAAPKPEPAGDMKPQANQMARAALGDKQNANQQSDVERQSDLAKGQNAGPSGKSLLKSQAPGQRKGIQEKQSAAPREQMSPELAALLASVEFSELASAGKKNPDQAAEEEVLVVYMTPRDALRAESSFESLLASNSIGLAEKPLRAEGEKQLQRSFAREKSETRDAEPRAEAALKDKNDAGAKDAKAVKTSEAEKLESPINAPVLRKAAPPALPPPVSDPSAATPKAAPVNELYYLEAEASQVDELLRQLRSSSDQFSRLNISSRALKPGVSSPQPQDEKSHDEKSVPKKPAATLPQPDTAFGDDVRAEGLPIAGTQLYGNQQPGELKQLAQGAAPVTPAAPAAAAPPLPAPPTPTAEPFAAPAPVTPKEISAAAAPVVIPNDAPAGLDGASSHGDTKGGFGQSGPGFANRRAILADKSQKEAGDRAIAYRLRGVESLLPAKQAEAGGEAFAGGYGGGGGAGMLGQAELDKLKTDDTVKRGNAAKAAAPAKPSDARSQPKSENGAQKQDAKTEELKNGDAVPASPPASEVATIPAPGVQSQDKKLEQPRPKANPTGEPARMPAESETQQRKLGRNKEAAAAGESSLTESSTLAGAVASSAMRRNESTPSEAAKKSAPAPATKKVRVLFVIEHEAPKE